MARQQKTECGCIAKDGAWIFLCAPCEDEVRTTASRWRADHVARMKASDPHYQPSEHIDGLDLI
jgi:hypothetical protein